MIDQIIILALIFFGVSILFSMLGMGGGVLYVPILLLAGFGMSSAPSISLILIAATSLAALSHFFKNKKVDWKLALVIDPPTDIMAFVGGYFSSLVPEPILRSILIVVLMLAGTLMLKKRQKATLLKLDNDHWWLWHREFNGEQYTVHLPLVLMATVLIGLFSGMLGITGGIIKLPIMVLLCGVPMDIAIATSTVMVAVTALSGIAGHTIRGQVDWHTGLLLATVAVVGGLIGSRISVSMNKVRLKKGFGVVVWIIALRMAAKLILKI
jgi:uncharacterized membrane protein YfcA